MNRIRTIIMGAAGRDFHNFNTFYRDNDQYEVVAFTATQIPNIEGRKYPAELAGKLYPNGIDIYPEDELPKLIKDFKVDEVVFAYSDVPHTYVMHKASQVNALGADFFVMGTKRTQVKSTKPVVAVCAVRTGSGKSQTTRKVAQMRLEQNLVAEVVADFRLMTMFEHTVRIQTDFTKAGVQRRLASGTRDAGDRIDNRSRPAGNHPGTHQRLQRRQRSGRITARYSNQFGLGDGILIPLRQSVDRLF